MKLVYFAWVRERVGKAEEELAPPPSVKTVAELKVSVPVSKIAKWKTVLQMVAVGFLIAGPAGELILPGTVAIGLMLLWIAAMLTLYTGWDYLKAGIEQVVERGAA